MLRNARKREMDLLEDRCSTILGARGELGGSNVSLLKRTGSYYKIADQ